MDANLDDIRHIRSMMERSSKFLSLSGMSGVSAGLFALLGAIAAYFILEGKLSFTGSLLYDLIITAVLILFFASSSGFYFSFRKARKSNSKLWMPVTWQILQDFSVPMIVGGLLCLIFIFKDLSFLIAPSMLIFYGLSLIYAGARTYKDIKILGFCEILLGLIALIVNEYSLIFWAIGFGALHIVYGIVMYYKYDMKSDKNG
jgi:hypothetical protein